jgi:hypothetical protein
LPPTATHPEDSQLASAIRQPEKRKRTEDDNYNNESSVPPLEKKTTRKPKAPEKKLENWMEVGLMRYPRFGDDIGSSLMQNRQCHYNLDIRAQINDMFLEERGYRGINPTLTMDSIEHSSTVGLPEQDMTSVVRLLPECIKHSVSTFCAVIKDALRTPSTCSRDNVSLARQWNVSLEAEKDSAKAAMQWRVEQILLGKKCRHRLEYASTILNLTRRSVKPELLYKEMYAATYERHKALLEVPSMGESNSSAIKSRMIDTGSTAYRGVKRRTITALRWADIQEKLKWAAIILGHAIPDSWFDNTVTYNGPWERIQDAVALYAEDLITVVQKELAAQLSFQAPVKPERG